MIYIKNSTEIQKIYIPKNDGMPCSSSHKGSGYDEGYHDGYVDGVGDGEQAIIATFTSATITENGEYGSSASPYSSVTVSIDTASTYNEGYESGVTDGEQNIINTFTSDTLTVNGTYGSSAHPYSSVTVDVDLDAPYESGYTDGYASGWSSGYSSGFSSGETTGYDEGYDSGYTSGMSSGYSKGWSEGFPEGQQDIINTFTSETLTVNGTYGSSAHPYSSVTVDVDMDAPYESGYTDGYESGYTSGYSSGYTSGETAGYDSGYSEGYESGYSSGSDVGYQEGYESGYTSGYSSGETAGYDSGFTSGYSEGYDSGFTSGETVGYESGVTDGYSSGYTSGETDGFNSGYTSGVTDGEQNIIDTFTAMTANTNGVYGSSAQPLSSITVDVPTGKTSVLTAGTFTENGTYVPVVTLLDYIETDGYDILFDTGVKMTSTGETVVLDFMPLTGTIHYDAYLCYMAQQENDNSDTWQLGLRQATAFANNPSGGYWYTNGEKVNRAVIGLISADTRAYVEISNTGITINGISSAFNTTTVVNTDCNIVLNGQYASNANYRCPYARYYGFKLIDDDGVTALADLRPALDGNIPCFFDMVSESFIHQFGTGHTTAGNVIGTSAVTNFDGWSSVTVNVDTAATYTSGMTDGEQNIIGTFTADTATTNGVYGSSAHPLSSLTVNVDQSGSYQSGYTDGYASGHSAGFHEGQVDIYETFTSMTVNTNGTYGSFWHPLSSITVSIPAHSSTTEYDYNTIYAKYNFASSGSKPILSRTYYVQDMYVDGSSASEVPSTTRNFSAGEHSIAFVGGSPNSLNKYCFYMSGTELTELVVGKAFDKFSDSYGGSLTNCTKLSAITLLYDGVVRISSGEVATFANNGVMYVPASRMTAYVQSPYWSQLFTNKGWTIEMIEDTQVAYNEGFDDGLGVGYESGASSVNLGQKTITANGTYRASEDGYDGYDMIEVDVPSGGSQDYTFYCRLLSFQFSLIMNENISVTAHNLTAISLRSQSTAVSVELFQDDNETHGMYVLYDPSLGCETLYIYNDSTGVHDVVQLANPISGATLIFNRDGVWIDGNQVSTVNILDGWNGDEMFLFGVNGLISDAKIGEIEIDYDWIHVADYKPSTDLCYKDALGNEGDVYPTIRSYGEIRIIDPCDECFDQGYASGLTDGYQSGLTDGYQSGITVGFSEGYQNGYIYGYNDGSQGGSSADTEALKGMIERIYMTGMTIPSGTSRIGWYAFYGCESLSSVTIPDSVTAIGSYAFTVCTGLRNITIPDSVSSITQGDFSGCTSLTSVTLGSGVTACTNYAFAGCSQLKTIYFRNPNPPTSLGSGAFPTGTAYASNGAIYVPSGTYQDYYNWTRSNTTAKRSFSGWTVTEYTLD